MVKLLLNQVHCGFVVKIQDDQGSLYFSGELAPFDFIRGCFHRLGILHCLVMMTLFALSRPATMAQLITVSVNKTLSVVFSLR